MGPLWPEPSLIQFPLQLPAKLGVFPFSCELIKEQIIKLAINTPATNLVFI